MISLFATFLKLNNIMPLQNASVCYGVKCENPQKDTEPDIPDPPEVTSISIKHKRPVRDSSQSYFAK